MIRVFESASGSDRLHEAERFVLGQPVGTEVRVVAATRGAADDFVRRVSLTRGSTFGLHRFSWAELVAHHAMPELSLSGRAIASRLGIEAVAARAVFHCRDAKTLGPFAGVSEHPGFGRAVASTLLELRLANVASAASPDGLAALREVYEARLSDASLVDWAGLVEIARNAVHSHADTPLERSPLLLLDVPIGSAEERDLLGAFVERVRLALVTLPAGDEVTWERLKEMGAKKTIHVDDSASGDLPRLRRYLFSDRSPGRHAPDGGVELFSAPGEGRECVEIVRRMRDLAREGIAFDQMAVFLRAPEIYSSHLETALRRAGIPAHFARGTKRPDPAGRAFLALLACKVERLSARRFAEYLSFGEVPDLDPSGAPPSGEVPWVGPADETYGAAATVSRDAVEEAEGQLALDFAALLRRVASGETDSSASAGASESSAAPGSSASAHSASSASSGASTSSFSPGSSEQRDRPEVDVEESLEGAYQADPERPLLGGTLRAPWKWEEYLVEAAVIKGRDRWARRLRGFEGEMRVKVAELRREEPESPRILRLETDLRRLEHFERFALPIIDDLDRLGTGQAPSAALPTSTPASAAPTSTPASAALPTSTPASAAPTSTPASVLPLDRALPSTPMSGAEGAVPASGEVPGTAAARVRAPWGVWLADLEALAPRVLRDPVHVLTVLAEMRPMSEIGPVTIDEVRAVLSERLADLERKPGADRYGKVFVGTPDHARGRSFRVVFVPGLAERLFPQRPREDPLLLDAQRKAIDAVLATRETRATEERLRLRTCVGAAVDRLIVSWPRLDIVQARPRVPSFYALDIARAVRGVLPSYEELERWAVRARLAWPAPARAQDAIDAVEHDLAVLGSLLESPEGGRATGRARYLLELNPHLARSLRTRYARWARGRWTHWDGIVRTTERTAPLLAAASLELRPYSVTALQKFAVCPYKFFLSAIQRLEPREEVTQPVQMDPLTRGSLVHDVQARTLGRLRDEGHLPLTGVPTALAILDQVLEERAKKLEDDLAPAIDRVWQDEVAGIRADLRVWLRRLAESAAEWTPEYFELAFGLSNTADKDASSVREPATLPGGWKLVGAVDLLERSADGSHLRVTDHKTGRDLSREIVYLGAGEILQPVLYSLAVESVLGERVEQARLSFCTSRGGFHDHEVQIDDFARLYAGQLLEAIDQSIREGLLPPAPREDACTWCDFRPVCGQLEESRQLRKDPSLLEKLRRVREQP